MASTFPEYPQDISIQEEAEQHTASKVNMEDKTQPVAQTGKYAWLSVGRIVQLRSVYPHLSNMVLQLMDKAFKVSKQFISKQSSFPSLLKSATGTTWGQIEEKYTTELWQYLTIASEEQIKWLMKYSASNYKRVHTRRKIIPVTLVNQNVPFAFSPSVVPLRLQNETEKYLRVFQYLDNCILKNL